MGKKEIVVRFLEEGYQLDTYTLNYFSENPEKIEEFIKAVRSLHKTPSIITQDLIKRVLGESDIEAKRDVKIIKKFFINHKNKKITILDYSNRFVKNYNLKSQLIIERIGTNKLLSINKIQKQKEFILTAMIREKDQTDKSAIVEDPTGHIRIYFNNLGEFEELLENDVVGIVCENSAKGIEAKQIIWPDISLNRLVNKTKENIYCLFISDFHINSDQFNKQRYKKFVEWIKNIGSKKTYKKIYIFILGGISEKKLDIENLLNIFPKNSFKIFLRSKKDPPIASREDVLFLDTPTLLEIRGIKFLLLREDDPSKYKEAWKSGPVNIVINILKRRDLTPHIEKNGPLIPLESAIINQIPDIFACGGFNLPSTTNYKGVSIITTGSLINKPTFFITNLKTREINKLDLS